MRLLIHGDHGFKEGILNEDICYNYSVMRRAKKVVESNQIFYYYFQNSAGISGGKLKRRRVCGNLCDMGNRGFFIY